MFRSAFVIATALAGLPFSAVTTPADAARLAPAVSARSLASPAVTAEARRPACAPQGCAEVACPQGYACVYAPKQCLTVPCPQYECVPNGTATPPTPPYTLPVYPYPYPYPYPTPAWPPYGWYHKHHHHYPAPYPRPHSPRPRNHSQPNALLAQGVAPKPAADGQMPAQSPILDVPGRSDAERPGVSLADAG
ncbi:hypothetical protein DQ384_26380 [Sphaerisporangium album]|uniref:Uncharacterized protein n=1 Tax=Sphaerisporangium album TaxID=509200 RepID=A0A367FC24_9ACTN|nr:hypothetical protein [Sphaerisporangium album]RCG27247.1 hypothetical protein DQ384_26380 [Sphaerisporangium album]